MSEAHEPKQYLGSLLDQQEVTQPRTSGAAASPADGATGDLNRAKEPGQRRSRPEPGHAIHTQLDECVACAKDGSSRLQL